MLTQKLTEKSRPRFESPVSLPRNTLSRRPPKPPRSWKAWPISVWSSYVAMYLPLCPVNRGGSVDTCKHHRGQRSMGAHVTLYNAWAATQALPLPRCTAHHRPMLHTIRRSLSLLRALAPSLPVSSSGVRGTYPSALVEAIEICVPLVSTIAIALLTAAPPDLGDKASAALAALRGVVEDAVGVVRWIQEKEWGAEKWHDRC